MAKQIQVVRWSLSETEYVDFENGHLPQRGEVVSFNGGRCIVSGVAWFVDDYTERGYVRCIATVQLVRVAK